MSDEGMIHKLHRDGIDVYVIAHNDFWLPGGYADIEAARYAFTFTRLQLEDINDHIYSIHGLNRPITMDDLKAARKARQP